MVYKKKWDQIEIDQEWMANFYFNGKSIGIARYFLLQDATPNHFDARIFELKKPWLPVWQLIAFACAFCNLVNT